MKQHFYTALKNAFHKSTTIQNDLISCCGEALYQEILQEIRADEV